MVWNSPSALFIAKTATPAEGNWAGVLGHRRCRRASGRSLQGWPVPDRPGLRQGKVAGLSRDVAEAYAPVRITVAYAGQTPVLKPFLMIIDWVRTP
jgi:hypothetical protein